MLDAVHAEISIDLLIHGAARGADSLADAWALRRGVSRRAFPADWARFGRAAGGLRNTQMLRDGQPELVIAFPGGTGTRNMIAQARMAKVAVREIKV